MLLSGYQFDDLVMTARPVKDYWSSSVTSKQFDGRINFAKHWLEQGIVINAERANIDKPPFHHRSLNNRQRAGIINILFHPFS